jgi:TRAP-type C4-dicarboxylate transport system permease small subunit
MRTLGLILFVVGVVFLIYTGALFYMTTHWSKVIPGAEAALPQYKYAIAASIVVMVVGLCLRFLTKKYEPEERRRARLEKDEEEIEEERPRRQLRSPEPDKWFHKSPPLHNEDE